MSLFQKFYVCDKHTIIFLTSKTLNISKHLEQLTVVCIKTKLSLSSIHLGHKVITAIKLTGKNCLINDINYFERLICNEGSVKTYIKFFHYDNTII